MFFPCLGDNSGSFSSLFRIAMWCYFQNNWFTKTYMGKWGRNWFYVASSVFFIWQPKCIPCQVELVESWLVNGLWGYINIVFFFFIMWIFSLCARPLGALTMRSHLEDKNGAAQLTGRNKAAVTSLLSCLMPPKENHPQPTHLMGLANIKDGEKLWNNCSN